MMSGRRERFSPSPCGVAVDMLLHTTNISSSSSSSLLDALIERESDRERKRTNYEDEHKHKQHIGKVNT
jgi:hypothetical protein